MLSRFIRRKAGNGSIQADDVARIVNLLGKVDSIAAVRQLLWNEGLATAGGLDGRAIDLLQAACVSMRGRGLGLEPNLIARTACSLILDRIAVGSATLHFSSSDSDFLELVSDADQDRKSARYADAQFKYWRALQLYPFHPGILVQYAHCLKEQGMFPDAIVHYMDAYRCGAPLPDVEQHLMFAAEKEGISAELRQTLASESEDAGGTPLSMALMSDDVQTLFRLFRGRAPMIREVLRCMSRHTTRRSLVKELMGSEDFSRAHRDLLGLLSETGRSLAK